MHAPVRIDNAVTGAGGHARCADVLILVRDSLSPVVTVLEEP